jgi:hypothetical protein
MYKLDRKFTGIIVKNKDGSVVPQDEYVVFLAKDNAFLPALRCYRDECARLGADGRQLQAIDDLISAVLHWRGNNPGRCKTPDVQDNELIK